MKTRTAKKKVAQHEYESLSGHLIRIYAKYMKEFLIPTDRASQFDFMCILYDNNMQHTVNDLNEALSVLCFACLLTVGSHFHIILYENGGLRVFSCFVCFLMKKKKTRHKPRKVY